MNWKHIFNDNSGQSRPDNNPLFERKIGSLNETSYLKLDHGQSKAGVLYVDRLVRRVDKQRDPADEDNVMIRVAANLGASQIMQNLSFCWVQRWTEEWEELFLW